MSKLLRQNVGGTDYTMAGCTLTGVCASAASDYIKSVTLSDGDVIADGMTVVVTFANGNTAGIAPASQTIYSSDQVNYYSDSALTQPFTLAPSGCYTVEYTDTGNAYTYQSFLVVQIGNVSAPLCDAQGHKISGSVWSAGDIVSILFSGGKFLAETLGQGSQTTITTSSDSTPYVQRVNADKDKSFISKLIGASFANNQLLKNNNFDSTSDWVVNPNRATFSVANNVGYLTNYQEANPFITQTRKFYENHKYLLSIGANSNQTGVSLDLGIHHNWDAVSFKTFGLTTNWALCSAVLVANANTNMCAIVFTKQNFDSNTEVHFRNVNLIDLTQMFGSAIADRIYAMEQASFGSGIAWIKSFGFFSKDYYDYAEGGIQNVRPSAHKISASLALWWTKRNVSQQYGINLCAEAILKPNTTYKLYFRGAYGAGVYPNEYIFTNSSSVTLNGELQSLTLTTRSDLYSVSLYSTRLNNGWIIFKNRQGNTVVPNFTEFYIVEEGVTANPTFSQNIPLANTELRGVPKLDANNNLYYDGDIYYPNGDVIRKYATVALSTLTRTYHLSGGSTGGLGWVDFVLSSIKRDSLNMLLSQPALPCKTGNEGWRSTTPCMSAAINDSNVAIFRIYETSGMSQADFDIKYNSAILVYELAAPTSETVAGYTNPQTCIRHGAEEFVDARSAPIPTGHETEYAQLPKWMQDGVIFL